LINFLFQPSLEIYH